MQAFFQAIISILFVTSPDVSSFLTGFLDFLFGLAGA